MSIDQKRFLYKIIRIYLERRSIISLHFQIKFLNPMITRKPKLRRQRKIFRQQGKLPRPDQMNINVAAWGRLLQRNFFFQKSGDITE